MKKLMNAATALKLIAQTEMKPFTKVDLSDNPLIGENGDFLIIIGGNIIEVFEGDPKYKESYKFKVSAI